MLTATYSCLSRIHNCLASSASRPTHCCRTSTPVCVIGGGGSSPPPIPVESIESAALRPCRSRPPLSDMSDAADDTELSRLWLPEPIPSDRAWRPRPSSPSTHLKQVTINEVQCVSYSSTVPSLSYTQGGKASQVDIFRADSNTYQSAWGGIHVARTNSRFDSESSRWDNEVACLPKNSGGSIRRSHFCTSPSRKMKSARSSD